MRVVMLCCMLPLTSFQIRTFMFSVFWYQNRRTTIIPKAWVGPVAWLVGSTVVLFSGDASHWMLVHTQGHYHDPWPQANWLVLADHWRVTYKTLTNQQPTYLYNSLSFPSHSVSTQSSDSLVLSIPYVRSSLGKRAFSVIGPRLWNSLPPDTRNSNSLPTFRSRLKTHLFKIAFPP